MTGPENESNIVKRVFGRPESKPESISPLFTYTKGGKPKKPAKPTKASTKLGNRLPAAVDFSGSGVRLLQLSRDAQGSLEVTTADEEVFPEDQNRSKDLLTKQALEKLITRNSIGSPVVVGLAARETQTFNFTFPTMSEDELLEAVKWKIKQIRPFEQDEENLKYAVLRWDISPSETTPGGQQRVTVVCVSNSTIQEKISLLSDAGLKTSSMHASTLALVDGKRFSNVSKDPGEVVLWLDIGTDESVFIVEKAGVVYFVRNLSMTGRQLTRQIAQALRVDDKSAEDLKSRHGLDFWKPDLRIETITDEEKSKNPAAGVCLALVSQLENLVIDIEHSFKFFSYQVTQSQVAKFDRVVLCGAGAHLKKLDQFLSDRLAVPVERLNPFATVRLPENLAQRPDLVADTSRFGAAMGLALFGTGGSKLYNFTAVAKKKRTGNPMAEKIKKQPKYAMGLALVIAALVAVPPAAMVFYYRNLAQESAVRVKNAREELKRRQSSQMDYAEQERSLLEKKAALDDKLSLYNRSRSDKSSFADVLVKLSTLVPIEVWITKLSYTEKKLILAGATSKNEHVVSLLENLKKPDEFSDVAFNYTKRNTDSAVFNFEVMMNVK